MCSPRSTSRSTDRPSTLSIVYPLAEVAGKTLQLELFDDEIEPWVLVSLDHVTLVRQAGGGGPQDRP